MRTTHFKLSHCVLFINFFLYCKKEIAVYFVFGHGVCCLIIRGISRALWLVNFSQPFVLYKKCLLNLLSAVCFQVRFDFLRTDQWSTCVPLMIYSRFWVVRPSSPDFSYLEWLFLFFSPLFTCEHNKTFENCQVNFCSSNLVSVN